MNKIIAIIIVVTVVVGAGLLLKKQKVEVANLSTPKEFVKSVQTTKIELKTLSLLREFLAEIKTTNSANIASKFTASIKKIYVDENDRVKKGDLLVALDDSEIQSSLHSLKDKKSALEADLKNTKNILYRNKKLLAVDAISQESYDTSKVAYINKESALVSTVASIKQLKAQLRYLNIRAPFTGRVGMKFGDDGSLALAGKPILTLNTGEQKLLFSFIERQNEIREGERVFIDGIYIGNVTKRYDDAKNSLLVAEVVPRKPLPYANNSYKTIEVEVDRAEGCSVDSRAILHKKEANYIMLYKEKRFISLMVNVVLDNGKESIITECPNEPIAIAAEAKLSLLPSYGEVLINEDK